MTDRPPTETPAPPSSEPAVGPGTERIRGWRWVIALPAILMIRLYQATLSRLIPEGMCRFQPTCSHYTLEAITTRGLWTGFWLGVWRVCRCNPFTRGGFDPVPPPRRRARSEPTTS